MGIAGPQAPGATGTRLEGEVVVVTGASGSLGRAICVAAAQEGAQVVAVARDRSRLEETGDRVRLGVDSPARCREPLLLGLDVRSEADMRTMAVAVEERFGRADALVTAHGIGTAGSDGRAVPHAFSRLPLPEWSAVIDTNLKGVFLSNRAVLPMMVRQGRGRIVNISSARGGLHGQAFGAAYCASKFGVRGLSEALAEEVRRHGIRVEVLLPEAVESALIARTSLGAGRRRSLPPERVAAVTLWHLCQAGDATMPETLIAALGVCCNAAVTVEGDESERGERR
jgi:NAD(P)-dependent dehydrogenase (short-subunit alcohol dehydrogenase family)